MLTTLKQLEFIQDVEQLRFSGQAHIADLANHKWTFHLFQGQIVFAIGGRHPVRRWRRHLISICPSLPTYRLAWQSELAKLDDAEFTFGWEYALLKQWLMQQKITTQQARHMIQAMVADAMFDLAQADTVSVQTQPGEFSLKPLALIPVKSALAIAEQQWESWQSTCLVDCSPHQAPRLSYQRKQLSSNAVHQELLARLDGQSTLLDLAAETQQEVIALASLILPLVRSGELDLVQVNDLPAPIYRQRLFNRSVLPPPPTENHYKGSLIACVDDSAFIRNTMEQMLTTAGYQFVGVEEPLRAIGVLLGRKPDLIFLDLMMPHIGGYELCEKLRKLSFFKMTPIVILTGNDGFVNRLRSDFVGASDFLAKPLDEKVLMSVIHKHLKKNETALN